MFQAHVKQLAKGRHWSMVEMFQHIIVGKKPMFPGLSQLMEIYLVLPMSTAVCERGFSAMKRIKSDWRSSLNSAQLKRLMSVVLEGPHPDSFDADKAVERLLTFLQYLDTRLLRH